MIGTSGSKGMPDDEQRVVTPRAAAQATVRVEDRARLLAVKCHSCDCTVAEVAPGGVLVLRRDHYGVKHETRISVYELIRICLQADRQQEEGGSG